MNPNVFGDILTFPLETPSGKSLPKGNITINGQNAMKCTSMVLWGWILYIWAALEVSSGATLRASINPIIGKVLTPQK